MRADLRGFKPKTKTVILNTDNGGCTQIKTDSSNQKSDLGVKSDFYPCSFRGIRVLLPLSFGFCEYIRSYPHLSLFDKCL